MKVFIDFPECTALFVRSWWTMNFYFYKFSPTDEFELIEVWNFVQPLWHFPIE